MNVSYYAIGPFGRFNKLLTPYEDAKTKKIDSEKQTA